MLGRLRVLSSLVFSTIVGSQTLGTKVQVAANTDPYQWLCELLQELDPCKLMGPDNTHPRELLEPADVVVRPFSTIFEKPQGEG